VLGGASFALHETAAVLGHTTSPQLTSTWFSAAYWRMAAIAALLTLPFLFAAAVQALVRSDLALLARAALGYLPLAFLAVGVAAPITMLLLAASDQLAAVVGSAANNAGTHLLVRTTEAVTVASAFAKSPFLGFLVGLLVAAGALVLWVELLMREAAVYIVVLMLPVAFAAMVWPARRMWAVRALEVLVALILAKFAIVAVLALGAEALDHGGGGITAALSGLVLVLLGAFAPWALLRLLPLTELASGAAGSLRAQARPPVGARVGDDLQLTGPSADWARVLTARMSGQAGEVGGQERGEQGRDSALGEAERLDELDRVPVGTGAGVTHTDGPIDRWPEPAGSPAQAPSPGNPAGETVGQKGVRDEPPERSPGLDPMWQAPDLSWRTLTLGPEDGWPPPPLWEEPSRTDAEQQGRTEQADPPGEHHDPLPPAQDPEHGSL
jgi:hypothetical protein